MSIYIAHHHSKTSTCNALDTPVYLANKNVFNERLKDSSLSRWTLSTSEKDRLTELHYTISNSGVPRCTRCTEYRINCSNYIHERLS